MRIGMQEQNAEIAAIVSSSDEPTFENTIEAYERSGKTLNKVVSIFYAVNADRQNLATTNQQVTDTKVSRGENTSVCNKLQQWGARREKTGYITLPPHWSIEY